MSASLKFFSNIPTSKALVLILWLFVALVLFLLGLSYLTIENLSAVRSYVGGEGLWSKAQKQAVHDLLRYSTSRAESDYLAFQQDLLVPLGDSRARVELEKPSPNWSVVRSGFIQGRNNAADVNGMATFFRRFRHSSSMSEAVAAWTQGDALIEQLEQQGENLHAEITSKHPSAEKISQISQQVDLVADQLTPLEDRFSFALGEGARQAKRSYLTLTFSAAVLSLIAGILFTVVVLRYLRQIDERYKHLINTANDVILVIDGANGLILDANQHSGEFLGVPVRSIIGRPAESLVVESDRGQFRAILRSTLRKSIQGALEFHLSHSDGRVLPVEVNTSVAEFEGKTLVQGIFRDLTERKRLEEEIRQAQKMEVIGRLAGGIAHDFNNLLMVILTQLQKIQRAPANANLHGYTETLRGAAERAASLTKELLAFGRKQVLTFQIVDLNDLLLEMKPILATLPNERVQLRVTPAAEPLPVKVDPGKIEQVVMNLALNACDAMPTGGILEIKTLRSAPAANQKENQTQFEFAVLEIKDTGSGMGAETKAHLFEPFFTTKPEGKGTGLGLSTVYGIVKQSDGVIEVDSAPGAGTTFRVYIPIVEAPAARVSPAETPESLEVAAGGTEVILLAEDQPSIRSVLGEFLEARGYVVLEAPNGFEALEIAKSYPGTINLLVTDVLMPQMRGLELAKKVSAYHPDIAVIFMSGYSEENLVEYQLVSARNVAMLQKPFELEQLARTIREALDKHKAS